MVENTRLQGLRSSLERQVSKVESQEDILQKENHNLQKDVSDTKSSSAKLPSSTKMNDKTLIEKQASDAYKKTSIVHPPDPSKHHLSAVVQQQAKDALSSQAHAVLDKTSSSAHLQPPGPNTLTTAHSAAVASSRTGVPRP